MKVETVELRPDDLNPNFTVYTIDPATLTRWDDVETAVTFNDAVTLLDAYWTESELQAGQTAELITVWQVEDPTLIGPEVPPLFTTDTVMFSQLLDGEGNVFAQRDSLEAPSWNWQAGDIIIQVHPIYIPPETAVGTYPAIVGFYDRASGKRALLPSGESYTAVPNLDITD